MLPFLRDGEEWASVLTWWFWVSSNSISIKAFMCISICSVNLLELFDSVLSSLWQKYTPSSLWVCSEIKSQIFLSHCEDCYVNNFRDCQNFFWVLLTGFNLWKKIFQFSTRMYLNSLCLLKFLLFPSPRLTFTSFGSFDFYVFSEENLTDLINL